MKTTFIYALCEPGTRTIRYIGKADRPEKRLSQHLSDAKYKRTRTHTMNWLCKLISRNQKPELIILREVDFEMWEVAEERYIRLARGLGMPLTNSAGGGEGNTNPSPESLKKMSVAQSGENNPFFGKHHTTEARASISAAMKLRPPVFGRVCSEETRKKMRGREHTEEYKTRMSARMSGENNPMFGKGGASSPNFGKVCADSTRQKISDRLKGKPSPRKGVSWTASRRAAFERSKTKP